MKNKNYHSVHEMFESVVDTQADRMAFRWFVDDRGNRDGVTWTQFYEQVKMVSKSLMALDVKAGDKVNIISNTCYQWVLLDVGIICAGACTVGIYQSNLPKDCAYIIDHSDGGVVFVEDDIQLQKLFEVRKEISNVRKVVMIKGNHKDDWVIGFDEFLALGKDVSDEKFTARNEGRKPEDPATLVYTSGTTGLPRGAVITHDNLIFNAHGIKEALRMQEGEETLVFLPLAHVMARLTVYAGAVSGVTITIGRGFVTAIEDIGFVKPDWLACVPRVYEKIYAKVVGGAREKGGIILKLFDWACNVGYRISDCKMNKQPIPGWLGFQYVIANKLVFSKLQKVLGGRIKWMLSGGAPLNAGIAKFFHASGILILEGIGMTEDTSFSHINRIDNYRFGCVGTPGPGIEHKLAEDGELMLRGRNIMKEYYKNPEQTADTITEDGWLLTGDIGEIDSEGFLKITGRKKEIIITSGGKNVAPAYLEGVLATSLYIAQALVVGDQRNFLTALVTLDPLAVEEYAKKKNIAYTVFDDLISHPEIVTLIESEIAEKNKAFPSYETIKKVTIVPEFTVENGLMTPTLKLKKNLIVKKYENQINDMYPEN